jgi:hypothetical protein
VSAELPAIDNETKLFVGFASGKLGSTVQETRISDFASTRVLETNGVNRRGMRLE